MKHVSAALLLALAGRDISIITFKCRREKY